jgi:hypothetical protein
MAFQLLPPANCTAGKGRFLAWVLLHYNIKVKYFLLAIIILIIIAVENMKHYYKQKKTIIINK